MKILQYLRKTQDLGLTYGGRKCCGTEMNAYADSDHATCRDSRRSVTGGAVILGEGAISWFSRMQGTVAAGTTEAEYVGLSDVVQEVLFLRQMQEFMVPSLKDYPIMIREDNEGAIKLANNKHASRRTRHIDVKHHIVRDAIEKGKVRVLSLIHI